MAIDLDAILANLPRSTADNPNYINEDLGTLPESNYSALINGQTNGYSALNANQPVMSNANTFTTRKVSPNQNSLFNQPIDYPTGTTTPTNSASYTPPNFKNNLLNYVVSPQGTGMAQGLLEASGYSTTPVSFGQALALGQKYGTANQQAEYEKLLADRQYEIDKIKAQPDQFEDVMIDGELYKRNIKTNEISKVGGGGTTINMPSEKGDDKLAETIGGNIAKQTDDLSVKALEAYDGINQISRFRDYLNDIPDDELGFFGNFIKNAQSIAFGLGLDVDVQNLGAKEALESLSGNFVLSQVQKTKGAISNKEMAYFMMISAGIGRTKEGNQLILDYAERLNNRAIEKAQAVDELMVQEDFINANIYEKRKMVNDAINAIEKKPLFTSDDREVINSILESEGVTINKKQQANVEKAIADENLTLDKYEGGKFFFVTKDGSQVAF